MRQAVALDFMFYAYYLLFPSAFFCSIHFSINHFIFPSPNPYHKSNMQPLILAAALMGVTAGFSSVAQQPVGQNLDPASVINPNLVNSEQWKQAVAIMDKTENGPSCPKRALAGLIDSCQSIDTQENYHAHGELSDIKKVHAARLAVCELDGAKVDNADLRACDDLVVQPDDVVSRHNWWQVGRRGLQKPELGPQIDKVQLKKCLEALHSNPQSWISYSNSLSVTHLMCQVSRVEIEKGESARMSEPCQI